MPFKTFLVTSCLAGVLGQAPAAHCQQMEDGGQRAGCPQSVAWWAIPSDTGAYTMYRVGGGCPYPHLAEQPLPHEGTWGWDYVSRWFPSNVILGWWHGLSYQGGVGSYRTDGPNLDHGEGTLSSLHDR